MEVIFDDLGGYFARVGDPAGCLFHVEQAIFPVVQVIGVVITLFNGVDHEAKVWRWGVSVLGF